LEYLFPEANVPGIMPPVNEFKNFPFLAEGLGYDSNGNLFGQLNPWPGASAPAPRSCGPYSPPAATSASSAAATPAASDVATVVDPSASPSSTSVEPDSKLTPTVAVTAIQTTRPGVVFKLGFNVTNSADFIANDLTYSWTQVEGPTLTLSGSTVASPSLTAPSSTAKATYVYNIKVSSTKTGNSGNANVTVVSDPLVKDIVTIESYTGASSNGGSVAVTARTNIVGYKAVLKLYLGNTVTGTATTMVSQGNGVFTATVKQKPVANGVYVTSDGGGSKGLTTKTA
jgi:hypothetical protein